MKKLLADYRALLEEVDRWFADCLAAAPAEIACRQGCAACCRGLFEISLLDAALLQQGFHSLDAATQTAVLERARPRVAELQSLWPAFKPPYILNRLPHDDWQEMPEEDPVPCPLLGRDGACLVYRNRPLLCRLHGLPNIDLSGESFSDDWCTLNFRDENPLGHPELRAPFRDIFRREFELLALFARSQLGLHSLELDTFIPSALLIDFSSPAPFGDD